MMFVALVLDECFSFGGWKADMFMHVLLVAISKFCCDCVQLAFKLIVQ